MRGTMQQTMLRWMTQSSIRQASVLPAQPFQAMLCHRPMSTAPATAHYEPPMAMPPLPHQQQPYQQQQNTPPGPTGTLFENTKLSGAALLGATGAIRRTFGPRSNAEGLLATGGAALATHASFDPDYTRSKVWIRHHAVGPAVLSPILVTGVTGALVEAAFPHGVVTEQTARHVRPLIVGVPVTSSIEVVEVLETNRVGVESSTTDNSSSSNSNGVAYGADAGHTVVLRTKVTRVRDDAVIAEGTHRVWVPDYLRL